MAPEHFIPGALKYTVCVSRNLCEPDESQVRKGLAGQLGVLLLQKKDSMLQEGRQAMLLANKSVILNVLEWFKELDCSCNLSNF